MEYEFVIADNVQSASQDKAEVQALTAEQPFGRKPYRGTFKVGTLNLASSDMSVFCAVQPVAGSPSAQSHNWVCAGQES